MIKEQELNKLVDILTKVGLSRYNADDLVIKATGVAQDKKIPVIKALKEFEDPGGHENSIGYHLFIAMREVSVIELNKLMSLNTSPE